MSKVKRFRTAGATNNALAYKMLERGEPVLKIGDEVKMNNKYYVSDANKEKVFTVKTEPQEV